MLRILFHQTAVHLRQINSSATTISSQKINATKTKDASKAVVNDAMI